MSGGFGEAASRPTQSSSFSNNNGSSNSDGGNFECSICLDLAQDPIVTLCGHLFCWPCIYKWLHMHSHSHECPICKAFIVERKLVPLYGRGKYISDTDSKPVPGVNIPNRPAGRRPQSRLQQDRRNAFMQNGTGYVGGFGPAISASFGNFTLSFGGFIPSIFNVQMHTLNYGGDHHGYEVRPQRDHRHEVSPLLIIGLIFLFALFWE
ncbi:zinc finger, RING/FYVE/PHD-type [Artemisia annua]|uniref:E3 ubiquitin-protein ligase RMA n=1 Tax=Artemisia annua TaxID=35608 RepID=A0A2U1MN83_ARTAN|nr:zinc finger, RING/FYVE/PHD-type [Artemisia annua]